MNLGKLLGAGKSIFGGEAPVVYRQNKQVALPKFNQGKNPFGNGEPKSAEPAPVTVAPAASAEPANTPVAAPVAPVVAAKVVTPAPSIFSAAAAKPAATVKPAAPKSVHATNWAERLNQLWAAKPTRVAPAMAGPMPNVQPDLLSLDSVKVLHNDLSDVDVEVVPMKSRPVAAKPAAAPVAVATTTEFAAEPMLKAV